MKDLLIFTNRWKVLLFVDFFIFCLLSLFSTKFWGLSGFFGLLLGVGISSFLILATWWMIQYLSTKKTHVKVGVRFTLMLYFMKIPSIVLAAYIITSIYPVGLPCFFAGLALVYCSLYYAGMKQARSA